MKKVILIVACLAILCIGLYYFYMHQRFVRGEIENLKTWKEFIPLSKRFKVYLPNPPQHAQELMEIPNSDQKRRYDMYASEKVDGTLFLVNVITYPSELDMSSVDILRQNIDELIKSTDDNRLKKILDNVFQTYKTLDFSFENKNFDVEGKTIQNGNTVYMLIYITQKGELDLEEYKFFVNSFHILDEDRSGSF